MKYNLKISARILGVMIFCLMLTQGKAQNWDINALKNINPAQPNSGVWRTFSSTAEPLTVGIPVSMFAVGLLSKDSSLKARSIEILVSVAAAAIATEGIKIIFNRDRPYQKYPLEVFPYDASEKGKSFPSAHTSLSFATATSLAITYKKWYVTVPAFVWATGVGYSRLYLGEHYPSDVLAGAAVGAAGAIVSHWLNKKIFSQKRNK